MKKKVAGEQVNSSQEAEVATAATEMVMGQTGHARKGDGRREILLKNLMLRQEKIEKEISIMTQGKKEYKGLFSADEIIEEFDRAELEVAAQIHYSLLERKSGELARINTLIRRAQQEEEFGLCEDCGKRIPEARLLIVPAATRCVPCQHEMEKSR